MKFSIFVLLFTIHNVNSLYLNREPSNSTVDELIKSGDKTAQDATNAISSPFTLVASKVNAFANSIPNAFAATGSVIGSAIAFPIQLGSSAASGAASGMAGWIIGVPVAIKSSIKASNGKDLFYKESLETTTPETIKS